MIINSGDTGGGRGDGQHGIVRALPASAGRLQSPGHSLPVRAPCLPFPFYATLSPLLTCGEMQWRAPDGPDVHRREPGLARGGKQPEADQHGQAEAAVHCHLQDPAISAEGTCEGAGREGEATN
jgi:hypothetical protein